MNMIVGELRDNFHDYQDVVKMHTHHHAKDLFMVSGAVDTTILLTRDSTAYNATGVDLVAMLSALANHEEVTFVYLDQVYSAEDTFCCDNHLFIHEAVIKECVDCNCEFATDNPKATRCSCCWDYLTQILYEEEP